MGGVQRWDTHLSNFRSLKNDLLPPTDKGVSALLDDLQSLGMLDETLVIFTGEFGRTPRIGKTRLRSSPRCSAGHTAPRAIRTAGAGSSERVPPVILGHR